MHCMELLFGILISVYSLQDGALCSEGGRLNSSQFEAAMRNQLHQYSGRRISDFLYHGRGGEAEHAQVKEKGVEEDRCLSEFLPSCLSRFSLTVCLFRCVWERKAQQYITSIHLNSRNRLCNQHYIKRSNQKNWHQVKNLQDNYWESLLLFWPQNCMLQ